MTGCPSREQLANLVAERTIEIEGFDLGEHMRSCPACRAIVKSLSEEGTTDSGRGQSGNGESLEQSTRRPADPTTTPQYAGGFRADRRQHFVAAADQPVELA